MGSYRKMDIVGPGGGDCGLLGVVSSLEEGITSTWTSGTHVEEGKGEEEVVVREIANSDGGVALSLRI